MDWTTLLPTVDWLNGLGTVGVCVLVMLSLITGRGGLALLREVKNRDTTIEWQRQTIDELTKQNLELVLGTRVSAGALEKVAHAAEEAGGGR